MDPKRSALLNPMDYQEARSAVRRPSTLRTFLRYPQRAAAAPPLDLPACAAWRIVPLVPSRFQTLPSGIVGSSPAPAAALSGSMPVWVVLTGPDGSPLPTGAILVVDSGWHRTPTGPAWGLSSVPGSGLSTDVLAYAVQVVQDPDECGDLLVADATPSGFGSGTAGERGGLVTIGAFQPGNLSGQQIDYTIPSDWTGFTLFADCRTLPLSVTGSLTLGHFLDTGIPPSVFAAYWSLPGAAEVNAAPIAVCGSASRGMVGVYQNGLNATAVQVPYCPRGIRVLGLSGTVAAGKTLPILALWER